MEIGTSINPLLDGTNTSIITSANNMEALNSCSTSLGDDVKIEVKDGSSLINCDIRMADKTKLYVGEYTRLRGVTISIPTKGTVVRIGNHCNFARDCRIHSDRGIMIGDYNLFGPGCFLTDSQIHHVDAELRKLEIQNMCGHSYVIPLLRTTPLKIGSLCWFGTYSQVHVAKQPDIELFIADKTVVAAGAIVKESIRVQERKYAGIPAVDIGPAVHSLTSRQLQNLRNREAPWRGSD